MSDELWSSGNTCVMVLFEVNTGGSGRWPVQQEVIVDPSGRWTFGPDAIDVQLRKQCASLSRK